MQHSDLEQNLEDQVHRKRSRRSHTCPSCGRRSLAVIHRRPVDRLINRFYSIRRYRCRNHECRWEGNLPSSKGRKELRRFWQSVLLWGMILLLACAAFYYVLLHTVQEGG